MLSGYGAHLVYVYSLQQAPLPRFEDVRKDVQLNWQTAQQKQFNADFFANLKSRYEIVIAELPADRLIDGRAESELENESAAVAKPAS